MKKDRWSGGKKTQQNATSLNVIVSHMPLTRPLTRNKVHILCIVFDMTDARKIPFSTSSVIKLIRKAFGRQQIQITEITRELMNTRGGSCCASI